jgi:hypothetical protein
MEIWTSIPGWEDRYEVSNLGRVRSMPHIVRTRGGGTRISPGKILRHGTIHGIYLNVTFTRPGVRRTYQVHRLVMLAFTGPCPEGMQVRHLNGIPDDNRLENLIYGTPAENMHDRDHVHRTNYELNRTHCPQGHPYDEENTYWHNGWRQCLTCRSHRKRRK